MQYSKHRIQQHLLKRSPSVFYPRYQLHGLQGKSPTLVFVEDLPWISHGRMGSCVKHTSKLTVYKHSLLRVPSVRSLLSIPERRSRNSSRKAGRCLPFPHRDFNVLHYLSMHEICLQEDVDQFAQRVRTNMSHKHLPHNPSSSPHQLRPFVNTG